MMEAGQIKRWWDLPAAVVLVVALMTAATRLIITEWTDYLDIPRFLALIGVLAGLALGQSRFTSRVAGFFATIYGLFFILWRLGSTVQGDLLWSDRMIVLASRLSVITNQLTHQEVVQDSLLFLVLMSVLFWVLGAHAGYVLTRYGLAWPALLPAGLTLFVLHSFDAVIARRAVYLAVYLFFSLVLVARTSFLQQHNRWETSRTSLPPHLGLDFIRFTLAAAALLVLFAWTAPALAQSVPVAEQVWQPVRQAWMDARDRMDDAFASLRSNIGVVSDYYGSSMMLGRGNMLTDAEMFRVHPPEAAPSTARFYWRARVYDHYINGGWRSSPASSQSFDPDSEPLKLPANTGRYVGTFDIVPTNHLSTVFAPSQPEWFSRNGRIDFLANPDGTLDITMFRANPVVRAGNVYQVRSSVPNVTVDQMKAAGEDYPDWVKEKYLQLPPDITNRTRQLAEEITLGLDTPYEKTVAVTNFLRDNIQYSLTVPEQPSGRESVDWFLFDIQSGFCNYYASAEVILLRTLGIPARWAVGYAQGERLDNGWYVVRQEDAHAWPEVYFPGLGWVEFEPTTAQPAVAYRTGSATEGLEPSPMDEMNRRDRLEALLDGGQAGGLLDGNLLDRADQGNSTWETARTIIAYTAGSLILLALAWGTLRSRFNLPALTSLLERGLARAGLRAPRLFKGWGLVSRSRRRFGNLPPLPVLVERVFERLGLHPPQWVSRWARQATLPPITRHYLEINRALSRLGRAPAYADTPAERALSLGEILPPAQPPTERLIGEYQRATFSAQPADLESSGSAANEVRGLSYRRMVRQIFAQALRRIQRPERSKVRPWQK